MTASGSGDGRLWITGDLDAAAEPKVEHVQVYAWALKVLLPRPKGDQECEGQRISIGRGKARETCPVRAKIEDWLRTAGMRYGPAACCMDQEPGRIRPCPCFQSGDADAFGTPLLEHSVQPVDGDGHRGRLSPVCPGAKPVADDAFPPGDVGLYQGAPLVA